MLFRASIAVAVTAWILEGAQQIRLGDPAPPRAIPQLMNAPSGAVATWPALRGQAVVLEFWATWCAPCVEQIPHLNKLSEQFRESKVLFLSVTHEDAATVAAFTAKRPIAGWIGLDSGRVTHDAYAVEGIPQTFLIDASGMLRGITRPEQVGEMEVRQLLAGKNIAGGLDAVTPLPALDVGTGPQPLTQILIRPSAGDGGRPRMTPGSYQGFGVSLKSVLASAYGVPPERVIGPAWLDDPAWDMAISVPPAVASSMWALGRQVLESTFQIRQHRETREIEVLVMTVAEGRTPPLRPSADGVTRASWKQKTGPDGGSGSGTGWNLSMFGTAILGRVLDKPIVNETGLNGRYDIELKWTESTPEAYTTALREQLGLELRPARRSMEHVVIDNAVRPDAQVTGEPEG
jgi:uncharacterized protein (TIGR03435 family)